jgi:hypothetical protein
MRIRDRFEPTMSGCLQWPAVAARRTLLAGAAAIVLCGPARAALGQDDTTVDADTAQLRAQRRIEPAPPAAAASYTVHDLQLPGGTHVREYLSAARQVFAVTWNGPSIPDLHRLLGQHYARYEKAAARPSAAARSPVSLNDADLVLRNEGHPRAFHGLAYLPLLLPAGFDIQQLR